MLWICYFTPCKKFMLILLLLFFYNIYIYSDKGRRYSLPFLKVTSCPSLHRINYLVAPFSCLPLLYIKKERKKNLRHKSNCQKIWIKKRGDWKTCYERAHGGTRSSRALVFFFLWKFFFASSQPPSFFFPWLRAYQLSL